MNKNCSIELEDRTAGSFRLKPGLLRMIPPRACCSSLQYPRPVLQPRRASRTTPERSVQPRTLSPSFHPVELSVAGELAVPLGPQHHLPPSFRPASPNSALLLHPITLQVRILGTHAARVTTLCDRARVDSVSMTANPPFSLCSFTHQADPDVQPDLLAVPPPPNPSPLRPCRCRRGVSRQLDATNTRRGRV